MSDYKPVSIPLAAQFKLLSRSCPKSEEEIEKMSHVLYFSAVDSLMYAMVCNRSNLSYAVTVINRFMYNSNKDHWDAVK